MMELKCPYCDNHQYVDPDKLAWEDGDEVEVTCRNCEHKFTARGYTTVDYSADAIDEEYERYLDATASEIPEGKS
jgi:predicted Zn finger-like uncharacterized protein